MRPIRLTKRGLILLYLSVVIGSLALGACDPLWSAMPWNALNP